MILLYSINKFLIKYLKESTETWLLLSSQLIKYLSRYLEVAHDIIMLNQQVFN